MIEITTGVVFLMSSMYGSGKADTQVEKINSVGSPVELALRDTRSFKDSKEVEQYLRNEFADTPILVEIARCESTFRHFNDKGEVIRGRVDRADVGVMQINERYHLEKSRELGHNIYTIQGNIAYAKYLYGKSGAQPWSASKPCWSRSQDLARK